MSLLAQLKTAAIDGLGKIQKQILALSRREQLLVALAAVVAVVMGLYSIYEPIRDAFDHQAVELAEAKTRSGSVARTLEQYLKLKARRDTIEGVYRKVEFEEGALSYLDNIIQTKARIPSGQFKILDNPARPFGGNYEQSTFGVRFSTSNLEALVDFLTEVVRGTRPLILGRLSLQKSRLGDRIEVEVDVSSLRKVSK